jgi:uncharacterized protein YegP (UPF0339 family)
VINGYSPVEDTLMTPSRFACLLSVGLLLGTLAAARASSAATTADPPAPAQAQAAPGASGRSLTFEIYKDRGGEHRWRLKSSNGQVIASSGQGYKDKRDCKNAIERIKKDAATKLKFETYQDRGGEQRWRLLAANGQNIASSGQGYKDKRDCEHAIEVIKKGAETAKVEEAE